MWNYEPFLFNNIVDELLVAHKALCNICGVNLNM